MAGLLELLSGAGGLPLLEMLQGAKGMQKPQGDPWAGLREQTVDPMQTASVRPQAAPSGGSGGGFRDKLAELGPIMMLMDPMGRNNAAAGALMQRADNQKKEAKSSQARNQTTQWLQSVGVGPQEASYLASDQDALRAWYKEFSAGGKPEWEITEIFDEQGRPQKAMVDKKTGRFNPIGSAKQADPLDAEYKRAQISNIQSEIEKRNDPTVRDQFGLNPIYGKDPEGNMIVMQPSKAGGLVKADIPEGVTLQPGVDKIDLGTAWGILNRSGDIVSTIPKDLAGAESQKAIGEGQGKAAVAAPGDIQAGQNALDIIKSLREDPNRQRGTGVSSVLNVVPGTAGYDFSTKVEQAKSGAFLSAIQQLRGMGALSNAEGSTATAAVTRMNTATSEQEFLNALADYETVVKQGMARAERTGQRFGVDMPPPNAGGGTRLKYNPETGELE